MRAAAFCLFLWLIVPLCFIHAGDKTAPAPSPEKSCVILSANDPATGIATWSIEGRARKHMLTFVAGEYPPGYPFRSSIKDKEVDKIKAKGGRVVVLSSRYTPDDLEKAKKSCAEPEKK